MSKYDKFETIQERIDRLQDYYDDPNNGLNKCFIVQKIKELKQKQLQKNLEKRKRVRIFMYNKNEKNQIKNQYGKNQSKSIKQ